MMHQDSSLRDMKASAIAGKHLEYIEHNSETIRIGKAFILSEFQRQAANGKDVKTTVIFPSINVITDWYLLRFTTHWQAAVTRCTSV
jgi:hypothetical protein